MLGHFSSVQHNEDYVLKVLQDVGLVSRKQIDGARARLNGAPSVVDLLVKDGVVSTFDLWSTANDTANDQNQWVKNW